MNKLSKHDLARRDEIKGRLQTAFDAMQGEWSRLEDAVREYNAKIDAYNEVVEDARGFASDMSSEIDNYISDKSDKWQEGERGEAFNAWKDEFDGFDANDIDQLDISEFEPTECDLIEAIDALPEQPE